MKVVGVVSALTSEGMRVAVKREECKKKVCKEQRKKVRKEQRKRVRK